MQNGFLVVPSTKHPQDLKKLDLLRFKLGEIVMPPYFSLHFSRS